ncbi:syntaxin-6-like [Tachypleus tridentatus]|uniref:syntaxin-6-like n=1 Tax=Tachypleus tridentatus TaxID=6853 RepID=UPI003FD62A62
MSLEDPFFVVKDEVIKAVSKTKGLYQRWCELQEDPNIVSKEEVEWTTNELRNGLRSIEWDLEDLEETVGIVEKNPKKFKIDETEINKRKIFITQTREEIKMMSNKVMDNKSKEKKLRQGLLSSGNSNVKYTRLENPAENLSQRFIDENHLQQQMVIQNQDEELDRIQESTGTLKTMSRQIGSELDEQAVMLEDLGNEMENTESRLDGNLKKMAKALHLSNDGRQWIAIGVLSGVMMVVIALFFII